MLDKAFSRPRGRYHTARCTQYIKETLKHIKKNHIIFLAKVMLHVLIVFITFYLLSLGCSSL